MNITTFIVGIMFCLVLSAMIFGGVWIIIPVLTYKDECELDVAIAG